LAKTGRPKMQFDLEKVEIFGMFRAQMNTMADYFGCNTETIERNMRDTESEFCAAYKRGLGNGKLRLYEAQLKKAEGFTQDDKYYPPDSTMLIWLGKNLLGQCDNPIPDDEELLAIDFEA
jgi:hypothetical protein